MSPTDERRQQYTDALNAHDQSIAALKASLDSTRAASLAHEDALRALYGVIDGLIAASASLRALSRDHDSALSALRASNQAVLALLGSEPTP